MADLASEGLRLRSELQRAIDEERYADAAKVRDRLKDIQDSTAEAASQSQDDVVQGPERKYQLGQRVKHAQLGYDGVVCGYLFASLLVFVCCALLLPSYGSTQLLG